MFTSYYNKENKMLIISSEKVPTKIEEKNNDIYFYNDELIGANISIDLDTSGLVNLKEIDDERVKPFLEEQESFLFGEIKECNPHPKSDHLNVCKVIDKEEKQIICGAQNCQADKIAIVAQIDAVMPNGMIIRPSKLLDIDSYGMLCSLKELGFEQKTPGIFLSDKKELQGKGIL